MGTRQLHATMRTSLVKHRMNNKKEEESSVEDENVETGPGPRRLKCVGLEDENVGQEVRNAQRRRVHLGAP